MIVEILDDQLELVEQGLSEHDVLRPDLFLVVGDEIPETEMLRHPGVFVLGCHFDEAVWILVGFRSKAPLLLGPVSQAIAVQPGADLLTERAHGENRFGAATRPALHRGCGERGSRQRRQRYPVFWKNEPGEDLAA